MAHFKQRPKKSPTKRKNYVVCILLLGFVSILVSCICIIQAVWIKNHKYLKLNNNENTFTLQRRPIPRYFIKHPSVESKTEFKKWINKKNNANIDFECSLAPATVIKCDDKNTLEELKSIHPDIAIREDSIEKLHLDQTVKQIHVYELHEQYDILGTPDIRVCVIDTGVNDNIHSSLGVIEQVDFTDTVNQDDNGHGTFVAGIIASSNTKYKGMAPNVGLYSAKVCDAAGSCFTSDIVEGIEWCVFNVSAHIINLSLGSAQRFQGDCDIQHPLAIVSTAAAINYNIVIVSSAGNDFSSSELSAPACSSKVLSVGALTRNNTRALYSNAGISLDIMAPGGGIGTSENQIVSALYDGSDVFGTFGVGTSYAAPHVTGVAALMLQVNKSLSQEDVRRIIQETAVDLGEEGFDVIHGYGKINALAALQKAGLSDKPINPSPTPRPTRRPTPRPTSSSTPRPTPRPTVRSGDRQVRSSASKIVNISIITCILIFLIIT